ncbi:hypothetical protein [Leyella stercorea]|uniref:hypothetical protein n=1 Tax=Leyella stercorea TaxID=363265 RepID=UPI0035218688
MVTLLQHISPPQHNNISTSYLTISPQQHLNIISHHLTISPQQHLNIISPCEHSTS